MSNACYRLSRLDTLVLYVKGLFQVSNSQEILRHIYLVENPNKIIALGKNERFQKMFLPKEASDPNDFTEEFFPFFKHKTNPLPNNA